jgi:hypothetical protein
MAQDTIYFNSLRGKKTQYGTKVSVNVEKFIEELKAHQNEKGYVNMEFKDRKEADKFGNNVYAVLDTWKPTGTNKVAVQDANMETASNDNLPF